jgi:hypothetical protein
MFTLTLLHGKKKVYNVIALFLLVLLYGIYYFYFALKYPAKGSIEMMVLPVIILLSIIIIKKVNKEITQLGYWPLLMAYLLLLPLKIALVPTISFILLSLCSVLLAWVYAKLQNSIQFNVTQKGISITTFLPIHHNWQQVQQCFIQHGYFTIDQKNNKIRQIDVEQLDYSFSLDDFNKFCAERIKEAKTVQA